MRQTALHRPLLAALCAFFLLGSGAADAQRRILGAPTAETTEDDADADERDAQKEADAKARRNAQQEKRRQQEEAEAKEREAKEAAEAKREAEAAAKEEAEEQAAAEKKRLAEEARARKEAEAQQKEEQRQQELRDGRLKAAKARRRYTREAGTLRGTLAVEPGAMTAGNVVEVRIDIAERLKAADPRFGNTKPLTGLKLVATWTQPSKRAKAQLSRYVVHALRTPGSYGFHHTPSEDGDHALSITGETASGERFSFEVPLQVGVWPPADFDAEEAQNARFESTVGGRRALGAR